jgi:hypothetical protein
VHQHEVSRLRLGLADQAHLAGDAAELDLRERQAVTLLDTDDLAGDG